MAKKFKQLVTLFFLEGARATEAEMEAAAEFQPGVQFRNANYTADTGALEPFDRLAGKVPARYQAAQDAKDGVEAEEGPVEPQTPAPAPTDGGKPAVKPPAPNPGAGWSGNS